MTCTHQCDQGRRCVCVNAPTPSAALLKWDARFLGLAHHVAGWSKDPSTKVGAVIADRRNRVVSLGYNGFPAGVADAPEGLADRSRRLAMTIHAEENALLFAAAPVTDCTTYVTHPPCPNCAAKLIQAGIARVVWPQELDPAFTARWGDAITVSIDMLNQAGVAVVGGLPC